MVTTAGTTTRAWEIAAAVPDPELSVVTIGDLGILCDLTEDDQGRVHVQITPTYADSPSTEAIRADLIDTLTCAGYLHVDVEFVLSPSWTADRITDEGHRKLRAAGVPAPGASTARHHRVLATT
jgi:ring-1,2-phenylacetyl-CoA epoxidase subunit PaaD